jgi:FkbM family methyltransferase
MIKLLRQTLAPLKRWIQDPQYRQWIRLNDRLRHWPPLKEKTISFSGLTLKMHDASAFLNMYENIFLHRHYWFKAVRQRPVILDCGANIGLATIWFARTYPGCVLHAFEPDPYLFELLRFNVHTNHVVAELHPQAVWHTDGTVPFNPGQRQEGTIHAQGRITVNAVRLKKMLCQFDQVDFLKLDVEGAEFPVLSDCRDELHRVRRLFVECHFADGDISPLSDLVQVLSDNHFHCRFQSPCVDSPMQHTSGLVTLDVFASRIPS